MKNFTTADNIFFKFRGRYNGAVAQKLFWTFSNHWENFLISVHRKCSKPTPLLHVNVQMPGRTKCNQSNWGQPVSLNQGHQSPLQRLASWSFQSAVYTSPKGAYSFMLGQINLKLMEELGCSKRLRRLHNYQ